MREVFEVVGAIKDLHANIGELVNEEAVDLGDSGGVVVGCGSLEIMRVGEPGVLPSLWGLDSHSRVLRLEGLDIYVVTGSLVGRDVVLVPGLPSVRWIGIKLRYGVNEGAVGVLEGYSSRFYVKSRYLGRYFDGAYNEEAVRDEVRTHVEVELARVWRRYGDGVLLLDGPIFPTPKVLGMEYNVYSVLYRALVGERLGVVGGRRVLGIVKRISHSRYLASCMGVNMDDETLARRGASGYGGGPVAIGPVSVYLGDGARKVCWYLVVPVGRSTHVVRVEALDDEFVRESLGWVAHTVDPLGTPKPISIADKLARRLSAAVYKLLWGLSPVGVTYESMEELGRVLRELGEGS